MKLIIDGKLVTIGFKANREEAKPPVDENGTEKPQGIVIDENKIFLENAENGNIMGKKLINDSE